MPLTAVDFVPKGPVKSLDLMQFYNLFTGAMNDQPVTFSNVLNVGGAQDLGSVPLRVYGAVGQTTDLIDLYTDRNQATPGFGMNAAGSFAWGPGGAAPQDTFMTRIGGSPDTAGLHITPALNVSGPLSVLGGSLSFGDVHHVISNGGLDTRGSGIVNVVQNLAAQDRVYIGFDYAQWFREIRPTVIGASGILSANGADPWGASLGFAEATLVSRGLDLVDTAGALSTPLSAHVYSTNWLQFNVRFVTQTAGQGWPAKALYLSYDVDNSPFAGGYITMLNGRVGVNMLTNATGGALQVQGNATVNGDLYTTRGNGTGAVFVGDASHYLFFDGTNYQFGTAATVIAHGDIEAATFNGQHLPIALPTIAVIRTGTGIFVGANIGPGQGSSVQVTFSSPFPAPPVVTLNQVQGGADQPYFTIQATSITTTGFTAHCQNISNSQTSNCVIDYVAVYGGQG